MEVGSIDVTEDWCLLREEWPIHKSRRGSQGIEAGLSTRCSKRHVMLREKGKVLKEKERRKKRRKGKEKTGSTLAHFVITIKSTNMMMRTTITVRLQFSLAFLEKRSKRPRARLNWAS
jgi:hypothetical protein